MKRKSKVVRVLLPLLCMVVLSAVLLLSTAAIRQAVWGAFEQPVTDLPTIATTAPLDITAIGDTTVSSLLGCYDANGTLVAYTVETSVVGYNAEAPIIMTVTVSADGEVLRGIQVLSQKESEYYGARIKEASFQERFSNRYLPVYLSGESGRGAHVDGLSGATVTSKAVVKAVNLAGEFVRTHFVEGE